MVELNTLVKLSRLPSCNFIQGNQKMAYWLVSRFYSLLRKDPIKNFSSKVDCFSKASESIVFIPVQTIEGFFNIDIIPFNVKWLVFVRCLSINKLSTKNCQEKKVG